LTRYVIDTHPDISCPPELHLARFAEQLDWVLKTADGHNVSDEPVATVLEKERALVSGIMNDHLARVGKQVWCDKSVTTVDYLPLVQNLFPDARFICLYRHGMDVVHSGLEVSRFGFEGYGFAPYVAGHLDNILAGLIEYWCDKTAKTHALEKLLPEQTFRLRYEDLVSRPRAVIADLFGFLGYGIDADFTDRIFQTAHQPGAGDDNIIFTNRFEKSSLGNGQTLSLDMIPEAQLKTMNALLEELGYPVVEEGWRLGSAFDLEEQPSETNAAPAVSLPVRQMLAGLGETLTGGDLSVKMAFTFDDLGGETWFLAVSEGTVSVEKREQGTEGVDCVIDLETSSLSRVLSGEANPMKLVHAGKIRLSGNVELAGQLFMQ